VILLHTFTNFTLFPQFNQKCGNRYSTDREGEHDEVDGLLSAPVMFDVMDHLSAKFGGFESLDCYKKFLSYIAPRVLDLLFGVTPKTKL
jgi:hypothetical protein